MDTICIVWRSDAYCRVHNEAMGRQEEIGRRKSDYCLNVEQAEIGQGFMLAGSVDLFVNSNKNSCDITSHAGPVGLFLTRKGCDIGFNFVNSGGTHP